MLNNLKAELVRKGFAPEKVVEEVLGCTYKTAKSKLNGDTDFSVNEAFKIVNTFFATDEFSYEFLFKNESINKSA